MAGGFLYAIVATATGGFLPLTGGTLSGDLLINNALQTIEVDNIQTSQVTNKGLLLTNTTAATNVLPVQYSPAIYFSGQAYQSGGAIGSKNVQFRQFAAPQNGASSVNATLLFQSNTNGSGWLTRASITDTGLLSVAQAQIGTAASIAGTLYNSTGITAPAPFTVGDNLGNYVIVGPDAQLFGGNSVSVYVDGGAYLNLTANVGLYDSNGGNLQIIAGDVTLTDAGNASLQLIGGQVFLQDVVGGSIQISGGTFYMSDSGGSYINMNNDSRVTFHPSGGDNSDYIFSNNGDGAVFNNRLQITPTKSNGTIAKVGGKIKNHFVDVGNY
jgi:hypothetical protein